MSYPINSDRFQPDRVPPVELVNEGTVRLDLFNMQPMERQQIANVQAEQNGGAVFDWRKEESDPSEIKLQEDYL